MRIGRAKNKSIILEKGDIFHIPPGLMHMRIALEDTLIMNGQTKMTILTLILLKMVRYTNLPKIYETSFCRYCEYF